MKIEISRRKFLQGSVALSVACGASFTFSNLLANSKRELKPTTKTGLGEAKEVATLCEMCVNKCALFARVEDGIITKLNPNPRFPKSRNMLCPRGNAGIQALYDPDRLKYPLIRDGEKGSGKFKRVTWEEAYQFIEKKMVKILDEEKDNRSTFLFCAGEGMAEHTFKTFYTAFGSANWLNHASLCLQTVVSGYGVTLGEYPKADLENAKYIIMAGANRAEAIVTPDTMDIFKRTKGRGAKLICIDPRFTNTSAKADKWLAINPGTDLAFVLALTYVAISEKIYNIDYVKNNFNGFEEYQKLILDNKYTPKWAEEITGIKAEDIIEVAYEFMANAPKAIYYPGRRSTFAKNDFQLRRAMAIFQALGGGIDVKGGLVFGKKLPLKKHHTIAPIYDQAEGRAIDRRKEKSKESKYTGCAIPSGGGSWISWRNRYLANIMPYKVRGMFIYKHNPVLNMPDTEKTKEMLKKMELVVAIDTMPSDTVMFADVVLPECTYLERTDPVKSFSGVEPAIVQRNKIHSPMFETKPVIEILRGLTQKISKPLFEITKKYDSEVQDMIKEEGEEKVYAEYDLTQPFIHSQEELNKEAVSIYPKADEELLKNGVFYPNMGVDFKKISINKYQYYSENQKFYSVNGGKPKTKSGKVECNLTNLATKGVDPMPIWKDSYKFKVPNGKFRMLTGRHAQFTQSGTGNNMMLRDLMGENYIWINKRIAREKEIKFGDMVEVSSTVGKIKIKAYPTEKIAPNQVFFIHGFGQESKSLSFAKNGGNDNSIIDDFIEPVYGSASMHETNVEIQKI